MPADAAPDPQPGPESSPLTIATDKVCFIILKLREFEVKDVVTEPDPASNASDDDMVSVLEDHADDPVQQELRSFIADMNEDEQIDLVALAWLGRDDNTIDDWPSLREEAARARLEHPATTARYLLGTPLVSEYIEAGLSMFGLSCTD